MSGIEGYHEAGMDPGADPSEDTDTQMHGGGRLPLGGLQLLERPEPSPCGLGSLSFLAPVSLACAAEPRERDRYRRADRRTLPIGVLGRRATTTSSRGARKRAMRTPAKSRSSSRLGGEAGSVGITNATTRLPQRG